MVDDFVEHRIVAANGLAPRPSAFTQRHATWSGQSADGSGRLIITQESKFFTTEKQGGTENHGEGEYGISRGVRSDASAPIAKILTSPCLRASVVKNLLADDAKSRTEDVETPPLDRPIDQQSRKYLHPRRSKPETLVLSLPFQPSFETVSQLARTVAAVFTYRSTIQIRAAASLGKPPCCANASWHSGGVTRSAGWLTPCASTFTSAKRPRRSGASSSSFSRRRAAPRPRSRCPSHRCCDHADGS